MTDKKAIKNKGCLLVFEGIDGSGKTTQVSQLLKYLKDKKIPFSHYSFPRYSQPWGKMVRRYLNGEFGDVNDVNPYLASVLYAGDRVDASSNICADLDKGKIVVCDRYVASNIAHQVAKIQNTKYRIQFVKWIEGFEYKDNKIPKEDLVFLLSLPPAVSQKLMVDKKKDIHEKDKDYLKKVWQVYEDLAKSKSNWEKVDCIVAGKLKKPEDIHKEVLGILKLNKII